MPNQQWSWTMDPECNLVTLNGLWIIDYDMVAQRVFLFKVLLESVVKD